MSEHETAIARQRREEEFEKTAEMVLGGLRAFFEGKAALAVTPASGLSPMTIRFIKG